MAPPRDLGRIPGQFTVPNAIQVNLQWTLPNGKVVQNILHGQVATGFSVTGAIAEAIRASIAGSAAWTAWAAFLTTTTTFNAVLLKDLRTFNNPLVPSTGAAVAGTAVAGTNSLPADTSVLITLRTAQAGRSKRGRVYLPGLSNLGIATSGALLATAQTAAVNLVTQWQTSLTASGITLALINPARNAYTGKTGAAIAARPAGIVNVTSITSRSTTLRTQRRRRLKV